MYEKRVAKGALLLDRVCPGWATEIAKDQLAMENCDRCILGQLYGDYWHGLQILIESLPSTQIFSAAAHGFTLQEKELPDWGPEVMSRFAALADAWRAEIRRRLAT